MLDNKNPPFGGFLFRILFLNLLVWQMFLTPIAPLFEFNFTLHQFLVLFRPIIGSFALGTVEFY